MKVWLTLLLSLFSLLAAQAQNEQQTYLATVTGTVQQEVKNGDGVARIVTSKITAAKLYAMYGLSPEEYALVITPNVVPLFGFMPRDSSNWASAIVVLQSTTRNTIAMDKTKVQRVRGLFSSPAPADNMFFQLTGAYPTTQYRAPGTALWENNPPVSRAVITMTGGNNYGFFNLKAVTGKRFVPRP